MHLQIPTTQIGEQFTLGILGTEPVGGGTRVHFILRISYTNKFVVNGHFNNLLIVFLNTNVLVFPPMLGNPDWAATSLFSLVVKGDLRNPRKYLKVIARRIKKAVYRAELDAELEVHYSKLDEQELEYGATGSC